MQLALVALALAGGIPKRSDQRGVPLNDEECLRRVTELLTQVEYDSVRGIKMPETDASEPLLAFMETPKDLFSQPDPSLLTRFADKTPAPKRLAVENGDASLAALRINMAGKRGLELFEDYVQILTDVPSVELWCVVGAGFRSPPLEKKLEKLPASVRARVKIIPHAGALDSWAQDGSKPAESGDESIIPAGGTSRMDRPHYYDIVRSIEAADLIKATKTHYYFEGGNVIVGAKHVFMGTDIIQKNMKSFGMTQAETIAALSAEFGKPVIEIGYPNSGYDLRQISFHIDLSMAVVRDRKSGDEVVVVESPRLLLEKLLDAPSLETMTKAEFDAFLDKIIKNRAILNKKGLSLALTQGEVDFVRLCAQLGHEQLKLLNLQYDFYAKLVESHGYRVLRAPGLTKLIEHDSSRQFIFGHSNVILSNDRAILPETGVRFLDEAGKAFYAELGYTATLAKAAKKALCLQGGSRCMTETYRRPKAPLPKK